jgi:hypothetical protein
MTGWDDGLGSWWAIAREIADGAIAFQMQTTL